MVVSMHLRARLHHPSLTWEVAAYAIPPVAARYAAAVSTLPLDGPGCWWSLARYAGGNLFDGLFGAPGRLRRRSRDRRRRARALERTRREIDRRHLMYDYGARDSIRERVSDWRELGHSERTDSQDFLQRLQSGVLAATERFLKDHNVDTGSYDQAQQVINSIAYTFGDVHGPAVFGDHGQITQHGPAGAPARSRPPTPSVPNWNGPAGNSAPPNPAWSAAPWRPSPSA
ncbi:hypothetical protein [Streptomyces sp. NPDC012888]|uniref:hypothetical protein n=1 Tax=Streptomyces sp. NPDC012888 TaxID=3364855 RepID=UPI0036AC93FF